MPKPKSGTVTLDVAAIVKELKSGRIEYRADKTGVVHIPMGKLSFDVEKLQQNVTTAFQTVLKDRPTDAKGDYIATFFIAGTMSPGIRINTKELR